MDVNRQLVSDEQLRYAAWLDAGTKVGLVLLVTIFAVYATGVVAPAKFPQIKSNKLKDRVINPTIKNLPRPIEPLNRYILAAEDFESRLYLKLIIEACKAVNFDLIFKSPIDLGCYRTMLDCSRCFPTTRKVNDHPRRRLS